MISRTDSVVALLYLTCLSLFFTVQAGAAPEWIWSGSEAQNDQTVYFRTSVEVPDSIDSASLAGTCDNRFTAYVNGKKVLKGTSWKQMNQTDVTSLLKTGTNVIAVKGSNKGGSAGLLLRLRLDRNQGDAKHNRTISTSDTWLVSEQVNGEEWKKNGFDDSNWQRAHSFGEPGVDPWGDQVQFPVTDDRKLNISAPEGFTVERVYDVPSHQGSWASLTFLPGGDMVVSGETGLLHRISPVSGDYTSVEVNPIKVYATRPDGEKRSKHPLGSAQGLAWANDSLYAVTTSRGKRRGFGSGFYRIFDRDGDGSFDDARLLRRMRSHYGAHGQHSVVPEPDGNALYVITGNRTDLLDLASSRQPPVWAEDQLLPRIPPPSGHAQNTTAPGGCLYRTDPNGEQWELIASGMRNAYDFDFNRHGEIFTFDADMEYDIGLPWYRPTRVTHVPSGAEFGWRNGSGKWPPYYPDSLPPTLNIGRSSPTGVTFGYEADFPEPYQNALFIGDWSLGRIFAVQLAPDGATYTGRERDFISGRPLPVTDMQVGPDGALYFITGGRETDSSLYRVSYDGDPSKTRTLKPLQVSGKQKNVARDARKIRNKLERLHGTQKRITREQLEFAWSHLSSDDRFIQYAARLAVEHADVERWRSQALSERNPQALIMAQLALARHGSKDVKPQMVNALSRLNWSTLDRQQKRALLRVYALIMIRMGDPDAEHRRRIIEQLNPQYPADHHTVNRELNRVLAYLQAPNVVPKTMELLKTAASRQQEIHYGYVLRVVEDGWTLDHRKTFLEWANRAINYGGGRSLGKYVREIKKQVIDTMDGDTRKQLSSLLDDPKDQDQPDMRTEIVNNWSMEELLPAVRSSLEDRDFDRGKRMYRVAQCSTCHQFNGSGGIIGPDLTTVGERFDRKYILESILNPSEVIAGRYEQSIIKLNDGSTVMGQIVNLDSSELTVQVNPMNPSGTRSVPRSKVESIESSDVSPMPPGLLNTLTKEEIKDLFAYLLSGGDPDLRERRENRRPDR